MEVSSARFAQYKRPHINNKLQCLKWTVQAYSQEYVEPHHRNDRIAEETAWFKTQGWDIISLHMMTPPELLQPVLDNLELPKKCVAADLGSGLGMASFILAADSRIEKVVGFEIDTRLGIDAEDIRKGLGLTNIEFRHANFLDPKTDLREFDLVYFFKPFIRKFNEKMSEKLKDVKKGALVISRNFHGDKLFSHHNFEFQGYRIAAPHDIFYIYKRI